MILKDNNDTSSRSQLMFEITAQHRINKNILKKFTFFDTCGSANPHNSGITSSFLFFFINIYDIFYKFTDFTS